MEPHIRKSLLISVDFFKGNLLTEPGRKFQPLVSYEIMWKKLQPLISYEIIPYKAFPEAEFKYHLEHYLDGSKTLYYESMNRFHNRLGCLAFNGLIVLWSW